MTDAYRKAGVFVQNRFAGVLEETEEGYLFSYAKDLWGCRTVDGIHRPERQPRCMICDCIVTRTADFLLLTCFFVRIQVYYIYLMEQRCAEPFTNEGYLSVLKYAVSFYKKDCMVRKA